MPPATPELITAVRHPLRRRILRVYLDEGLESASAEELAAALDESISRTSYHLKTLAHCDILNLVRSEKGGEPDYRWALSIEARWLRVVLEFWVVSEFGR
jgi:DNA-binding transcriptional ArsR family regulator